VDSINPIINLKIRCVKYVLYFYWVIRCDILMCVSLTDVMHFSFNNIDGWVENSN
jgi:hypothetical protein